MLANSIKGVHADFLESFFFFYIFFLGNSIGKMHMLIKARTMKKIIIMILF